MLNMLVRIDMLFCAICFFCAQFIFIQSSWLYSLYIYFIYYTILINGCPTFAMLTALWNTTDRSKFTNSYKPIYLYFFSLFSFKLKSHIDKTISNEKTYIFFLLAVSWLVDFIWCALYVCSFSLFHLIWFDSIPWYITNIVHSFQWRKRKTA